MAGKIPFCLVTGFLGSGKTTFLKHVIENYANTRKLAIIQNEFASVNLDGRALNNMGKAFDLIEINNGSVFCVCLLGNFVESLVSFLDQHQPDLIFLEASGLSDPISIGQVMLSDRLKDLIWLAHIYTITDAVNFSKTVDKIRFNQHQIQIADTILLNKVDLVHKSKTEIHERIAMLNPFAKVIETSYCSFNFDFEPIFHLPNPIKFTKSENVRKNYGFESAVIKTTKPITLDNFTKFLRNHSEDVIRIKGYINALNGNFTIQAVFGQLEILPLETNQFFTELILIGQGIDQKEIQSEFEYLCNLK